MIVGWFKFALYALAGLTVLYWLLRIYLRSLHREELEKRWADAGGDESQADFVARGMAEFDRGLWKRLILLVYIVPAVVVPVLIYILNFQ